MAEPLKQQFGTEVFESIADDVALAASQHSFDFDRSSFVAACADGYDALELMPRARHIADALAGALPDDQALAMRIIGDALGSRPGAGAVADGANAMASFRYLPYVEFVAAHGHDDFDTAMQLQYELTKLFTAEFSIRTFLVGEHRDATFDRLRAWTRDPDQHVRRLVSEGTRPRLPWASRLREFIDDPEPVIALLELLRADTSEYVRRSVANNLNDIAKDHPDRVIEICRRWWNEIDRDATEAGDEGAGRRRWMIRHALRTLVKNADPDALGILGFDASSPVEFVSATIEPDVIEIGGRVRIEVELTNPSDTVGAALVDLRVHFVKADGSTSPKVFKGAEIHCEPAATVTVRKTISVAQHSTRTHHPGTHAVEAIINGVTEPLGAFDIA